MDNIDCSPERTFSVSDINHIICCLGGLSQFTLEYAGSLDSDFSTDSLNSANILSEFIIKNMPVLAECIANKSSIADYYSAINSVKPKIIRGLGESRIIKRTNGSNESDESNESNDYLEILKCIGLDCRFKTNQEFKDFHYSNNNSSKTPLLPSELSKLQCSNLSLDVSDYALISLERNVHLRRLTLNKFTPDYITVFSEATLGRLTELNINCIDSSLYNLTGFESLTNLKKLYIGMGSISSYDLKLLNKLKIESLCLSRCMHISTLQYLSIHTLKELTLLEMNCTINSLYSPLVETLNIFTESVFNFHRLKRFKKLRVFNLYAAGIKSFNILKNLKNIEKSTIQYGYSVDEITPGDISAVPHITVKQI